jgi:hypothetical protein
MTRFFEKQLKTATSFVTMFQDVVEHVSSGCGGIDANFLGLFRSLPSHVSMRFEAT